MKAETGVYLDKHNHPYAVWHRTPKEAWTHNMTDEKDSCLICSPRG